MKRGGFFGVIGFLIVGIVSSVALAAKTPSSTLHYTGERYRDPTISPLSAAVQIQHQEEATMLLPSLEVQGVIWGEKAPQAIINHQVVKKGEFVQGVEILEISREGIHIFFKGKSHILRPGKPIEEKR